jgi:tetratricopeptide (TPR) repeat protein
VSRLAPRRIRALAACALLALTLPACTSREDRLAERLAKADAYLAEKKLAEAVIELRRALKLAPTDAAINLRMARLLEQGGALSDAAFYYQEAHRLDPENTDATLSLAKLQMFTDPEASKALIDGVLEKDPRNLLGYVRRSEWQLARADTAAALQAVLTATEIDPKNVIARIQLGLVHRARIREHALKQEAIPASLYAEALGTFDHALALAKQAPDTDPELVVRAYIERANVLASWPDRAAQAGAAYREAAEAARAWPDYEPRALDRAAAHARSTGDVELQRWALERRVELTPGDISAWLELAQATDPPDAPQSGVLARLLEQRSGDARAHATWIQDLNARGRRDEAIAHGEKVAAKTDNPALVLAQVSQIHLLEGRLPEARAVVERLEREHAAHPQTLYARAEVDMAAGDFTQAIASLEKLAERNDTAETHRMLAEAKLRAGDRAGAVGSADRALELAPEPKPIELLLLRARALAAQRDWESAIQAFRRAEMRNNGVLPPRDALLLAQALYQAGRDQGGRVYLNALLTQMSEPLVEAVLLFARFEAARDPARARELLLQAADKYPGDVRVLNRLAQLEVATGHGADALARVDRALESAPDSASLRLLRARLLVAQGQIPAAIEAARGVVERDPEQAGATALLVHLLASQGQMDQARAELEAQAKAGTLRPGNRLLLARLHLASGGDETRAVELFEQLVAERSDRPGVKNDLAFLLAKRGQDLERARRLAEEARAAMPQTAQIADTLGFVYLKSNLPAPALDQFRAAIELSDSGETEWASFHYHLGLALKALDRPEEARLAFEKALASAVEFPEAEDTRRELAALRAGKPGNGG